MPKPKFQPGDVVVYCGDYAHDSAISEIRSLIVTVAYGGTFDAVRLDGKAFPDAWRSPNDPTGGRFFSFEYFRKDEFLTAAHKICLEEGKKKKRKH